ncbi:amidase [Sphingobium sp. H33]|uniref:Amidase n=2 Tax=Sphingobium nicotianae TaxID=2782607 RepID=A0A9X1DD93_9SPHN|nr:amidase [Sphingobium nicotianae]
MTLALATAAAPLLAQSRGAAVEEVSATDLLTRLANGSTTSEALVRAYLDRIAKLDRAGPKLRSIIALNPDAVAEAKKLDAERKAGKLRGPLHGLPILVKDNVETLDRMPTTAGSLALKDNLTGRDAPMIARLRAAGALILGKTNLSEWANIRSNNSSSGWSGIGGLVRNPYALDRTSCGSSSGTGAAIAASFAAAGIGTETDGSVVCPSSMNGLAGLKPTIGLVSRTHIVPISHSQDTAGPMARTVRDVALLFSSMVGSDPADAATKGADAYARDYAATLSPDALKGVRLGVLRPEMPALLATRYDAALAVLKKAGAELVEIKQPKLEGLGEAEGEVLHYELKADLNAYLASTDPARVRTRSLADVIAFNKAHADRELAIFGQETFEEAEKLGGLDSPDYVAARAKSLALARDAGIDAMLAGNRVAAIVEPSYGLPWLSDPVAGDQFSGPSASELPAVAGYPHLSVPMGLAGGLPVGLSFIGHANSDGDLLRYGYAFEQAGKLRVAPGYAPTAPVGNALEPLEP